MTLKQTIHQGTLLISGFTIILGMNSCSGTTEKVAETSDTVAIIDTNELVTNATTTETETQNIVAEDLEEGVRCEGVGGAWGGGQTGGGGEGGPTGAARSARGATWWSAEAVARIAGHTLMDSPSSRPL